jgi:hypothetical protein
MPKICGKKLLSCIEMLRIWLWYSLVNAVLSILQKGFREGTRMVGWERWSLGGLAHHYLVYKRWELG